MRKAGRALAGTSRPGGVAASPTTAMPGNAPISHRQTRFRLSIKFRAFDDLLSLMRTVHSPPCAGEVVVGSVSMSVGRVRRVECGGQSGEGLGGDGLQVGLP